MWIKTLSYKQGLYMYRGVFLDIHLIPYVHLTKTELQCIQGKTILGKRDTNKLKRYSFIQKTDIKQLEV